MVTERVDLLARVLMSRRSLRPGSARSPRSRRPKATFGVPGFLIWPAAALELTSAVLLLVGLGAQPVALVLAGRCLLTAAIFHTAWSCQIQQICLEEDDDGRGFPDAREKQTSIDALFAS